jgi:hypothetical protein
MFPGAPEEPFFAVHGLFVPDAHFLPLPFCARALAAAVLEAELVRPSLRTLLAAVAALELVCFELEAMVYIPSNKRDANSLGPTRRSVLKPRAEPL